MKALKISIPEGFQVDSFDNDTGEIKFKATPKNVTDRIKTVDDVLADNGTSMKKIDAKFKDLPEHLKHQYIAELLCVSLNEGWTPDWSDSNEYKYFPWFEMGGSRGFRYDDCVRWYAHSGVGSRLCLKSRELAKYAGNQFTDTYKEFMTIKTH